MTLRTYVQHLTKWEIDKIADCGPWPLIKSIELQQLYQDHKDEIWNLLWELKGQGSILELLADCPQHANAQSHETFIELLSAIALTFTCQERRAIEESREDL